jgi:hypothetical protein
MRFALRAAALVSTSLACGHDAAIDADAGGRPVPGTDAGTDAALPWEDAAAPTAIPASAEPPTIPLGIDAYAQWDRWPSIRIGMRAYMTSTYDRAGGNESADASHYIRQESSAANVALDVVGPGVLVFARANHWHGSPWHYRVDGHDNVVTETTTADPTSPNPASVFLPESLFPAPLALTWPITQGADLMAVPIPFEHALGLVYERTHYGTGYFIYDALPEGAPNLVHPLHAWDTGTSIPAEVLSLLGHAGDDIAPRGAGVRVDRGSLDLPASGATTILDVRGAWTIRALRFTVPIDAAVAFGRARLRVTWDERTAPSIDAPVALFFGAGTLFNRSGSPYLVKSLPAVVQFDASSVELSMYFPMPFSRHARVELVGGGDAIAGVGWQVRSVPNAVPANHLGYFHASYVDHGLPTEGKDLVLLDTTTIEGGGPFCGHLVGTSVIFSDEAHLGTLEGDPRFYFDGSKTPQGQGTGTEEWGGGGDYWGGRTTTLPLLGHPVGAVDPTSALNAEDRIESMYRFLLADLFPFGRSARIQLEHGGGDDSTEHYRTVAYWYGLPDACLVASDTLDVGDPEDEARHRYVSPTASAPETITSRFQGGVDHVGAIEVVPASTETGRHMTGATEFSIAIPPSNLGVMLRRLGDAAFPDQRAEVFVADDGADAASFTHAGTWYAAGSNQNVYSNPPGELDPAASFVQSVDRRFREDELLIPRALTEGRSALRVRIVFTPSAQPITPGAPLPPQAWSEYRYDAFAWRMPAAP